MSNAKELRAMISALEIKACYCLELENDIGCTIHTLVGEILNAWDRYQDDEEMMRHQDEQAIRSSYE